MEEASFPEISSVSYKSADMMRGEEAGLIGLCDSLEENCLYVLPGSHSKLIETDKDSRIVSFSTEMTGEIIEARLFSVERLF